MFPCPSKVPPSEFLNLCFYGLLRLFAFSHTYLWLPATEATKESNSIVHAAMFLAMSVAFLGGQAVRSIVWRFVGGKLASKDASKRASKQASKQTSAIGKDNIAATKKGQCNRRKQCKIKMVSFLFSTAGTYPSAGI